MNSGSFCHFSDVKDVQAVLHAVLSFCGLFGDFLKNKKE